MNESNQNRGDRVPINSLVNNHHLVDQALSWYEYLQNRLKFPFKARWVTNETVAFSLLEEVNVVGMAIAEACVTQMMVEIEYQANAAVSRRTVALADIQPIAPDADTAEAIADWHYWVEMEQPL